MKIILKYSTILIVGFFMAIPLLFPFVFFVAKCSKWNWIFMISKTPSQIFYIIIYIMLITIIIGYFFSMKALIYKLWK
jgi:hypothetical protein